MCLINFKTQTKMGVSSPNFRAPPPSPVASTRRRASFTANDDLLSEFLDNSGRVPNLVLPDKVFPKHTFLLNPPTFDFLRLGSLSALLDAIASVGCFQLVNHGVPEAMVKAAMEKTIFHDETMEEFVLYKDIVDDHSDLRELMGEAERIGKVMREKLRLGGGRSQEEDEEGVGFCYVKKHNYNKNESKEEAIRMLIRGYDERHSLCLNFCHAELEFHVYSKRGWFSFSPRPDAVVMTVGDEGWSGRFKGVVGRPLLYKSSSHPHHNFISISFLYTTTKTSRGIIKGNKKTISLSQQLLFALFLTLLFPFFFP